MDGLFIKLREEHGVAMVIVVLAIVVVTVIGAGLVIAATRDLESSTSVQRASSALGVAEAAVQHAMQQLRVLGPSEDRLGLDVDDESPNGKGRWMHLTTPTVPPVADVDGDDFIGFTGEIGATGRYTAYILEIDPVDLSANPTDKEGVYQIVATGLDRKDDPSRPGARTVEQFVRVRALDVPFSLFSQQDVDFGGTPTILSVSLYATGDVYYRSKVSVSGQDDFYGGPAAVHATGVIYRGNGQGNLAQNGPIHPPPASTKCDFPYDRDSVGASYTTYDEVTGTWTCSPGDTIPPYSTSFFDESMLPFDPSGPSPDTYDFLKSLAQSSGIYIEHTANSTLNIHPTDLAGMPDFFVLYVDVTGKGDVAIKSGWGDQTMPPDCNNYEGHFGIVVVRNGDLSWQNNEVWWGAGFVPEGEFSGSGSGQAWFVGTLFARNIGNTGNLRFQLNDCWLNQAVGPFFTVSRLRWHESDR